MASQEEEKEDTAAAAAAAGEVSFKKTYPEVYGDEELNPAQVNSTDFQVDHSALTSPKELKKQAEEGKKENKGGAKNLKSTLLISGVVVAVIGAMFAIVKKIKES